MAVTPSPEPPYNTTQQIDDPVRGQTVALSPSSSLSTGVGGGKTKGNE
jgi:hypothetical protein